MTHNAKFRRLAFITSPLSATRRHRPIPGHESWQLNVPYSANVGVVPPPAKGRGTPGKALILL